MWAGEKNIGIGYQDFEKIRERELFYVDKTGFIREWWEDADEVTLITRPRRFGKTLNMSMQEKFFSVQYAGRGDLFEGLAIWEGEKYQNLQGTYPVISLTFVNVKETTYQATIQRMNQIITDLYNGEIQKILSCLSIWIFPRISCSPSLRIYRNIKKGGLLRLF